MASAAVARWARGSVKSRAKTLIADVERGERATRAARVRLVNAARRRVRARVRAWARGRLTALRERARAARRRALERIRASVTRQTDIIRERARHLIAKTDARLEGIRRKRVAELDEALRLERLIHDRHRKASARTTSKERRQESDEEVAKDLEADMLPIWEAVKTRIRGTAKLTRTEAFLHWLHEHPDEVIRMRADRAEADVEKWLAEQHEQERRAHRGEQARATWKKHTVELTELDGKAELRLLEPGHRLIVWNVQQEGNRRQLDGVRRGRPGPAQRRLAVQWLAAYDRGTVLDDLADVPF